MTRELDCAVARALGWQDWCPLGDARPVVVLLPPREEWDAAGVMWDVLFERRATPADPRATDYDRYVPRYSTDANEAARLWADELSGCGVYAPTKPSETWAVIADYDHIEIGTGDTLAEAICRAVVAVRVSEAATNTGGKP